MTRHERAYRHLLSLYPTEFRARYGEQMVIHFLDQLRDAQRIGGNTPIAELWLRSVGDVITTAPALHVHKRRLVPRPVDPVAWSVVPQRPRPGLGWPARIVGLTPVWAQTFLSLYAPGFMDPLYANPPEVLGLPAGVFLIAFAMLLMLLGLLAIGSLRSPLARAVAFLLLTIPATAIVILAPAMVLIVLNLNV